MTKDVPQEKQVIATPPTPPIEYILEEEEIETIEENYQLPLPAGSYTITSGFGWRWERMHNGIDLAAPIGTPVLASKTGEVVFSGWKNGYGYTVVILHENGEETLYAHLSATGTNVGTLVNQGRVIGWLGNSGFSTGPHLHFEIRGQNGPYNPTLALNF